MALLDQALLDAVRGEVLRQGKALDEAALQGFLSSVGPVYVARESPESIARHARFASELGPGRRARLAVTPHEDGRCDVAIVAFDYFAELSILCGLLAAHGLDIERGHVHTLDPVPPQPATFPRGRERRAASPRLIVDVFRVRPRSGRAPDGALLERELLEVLDLAAEGRGLEARERLNLRLADSLGRPQEGEGRRVSPVSIRFDDPKGPTWTAMDVSGPDAPAFLYTLANAMALRGIYVHDANVESVGSEARDRFLIAHEDGSPLRASEQEALGRAVTLIQQFTHLLPSAPDPARALRYFDQFLDRITELGPQALQAFSTPERLLDLARLLGSSVFLWEDVLRQQFERLLPVVADWRRRAPRDRAQIEAALRSRLTAAAPADRALLLRELKDEETLLIEARRLLDPSFTLESFSAALTDLGEALVAEAAQTAHSSLVVAHGRPLGPDGGECPFAVLALGKFGGGEMGYASDLELLFAYGDAERTERTGLETGRFFDELVRETVSLLQAPEDSLYRVDLRLRPHGGKGPLASPLAALRDYYRPGGGAAPFERQALVKLRFIAGDEALGRRALGLRDAFVWSGEPWDREASLHLRERQAKELVPPGRFNVKLSRGGLVDAEYTVQYLQIQNGHGRPDLRTPKTLLALDRLQAAGILETEEHRDLRAGYFFWRQVSDALRVVRGHAGDLLLPLDDSDDYGFLARRLSYAGGRREAALALAADVARHRQRLSAIYDRRFRTG